MNGQHRRSGQELAEFIVDHVSRQPGLLAALSADALSAIASMPDIDVRYGPPEGSDGCGVAGHYDQPRNGSIAVITIANSGPLGRRQFTVLHEYAHHVQRTVPELSDALWEHPEHHPVEEAACNAFAARVLISCETLDEAIRITGLDATAIRRLSETTVASRQTCTVAVSNRMLGIGGGLILDENGVVEFSTSVGGFIPPKKSSDQASSDLFRAANRARGTDRAFTGRTHFTYSNGSISDEAYFHGVWCGGRVVALLVRDGAPWEKFSPPTPTRGFVPRLADCAYCAATFTPNDQCAACREFRCPQGHCACTASRERRCGNCFLLRSATQFVTGSDRCVDCR